jgi:hypothetical protein
MIHHKFKDFLSEALLLEDAEAGPQRANMAGNINDASKKGLRHLKNYVMPTLNKAQKKKVMANFHNYFTQDEHDKLAKENGKLHNTDEKVSSHVLASAHGAHKAGTEVKVTGARHDDQGRIILSTAQHGEIPQSKLTPPKELKKESAGKAGFAVEEQLAKNFGCKPAGSTKTAYDFTSHCADNESKQSKKLKGVVKETMPEKEQIKTPFNQDTVKGESKLVNAKMGQSALNWDSKTRQWGFTDKRLGAHYQKAMVKVDKTGKAIPSTDKTTEGKMVPLLQHLNTNHSDGKITNSFSIAAPAGSTRKYFSGSDVNSLHVHNKEKEHGTTFTVGDNNELKGVTTMGHLGNKDLDKLDGSLKIEATHSGKSYAAHWPKSGVMKELASRSVTKPELNRDVSKPEHATEIKGLIDKHNKTLK